MPRLVFIIILQTLALHWATAMEDILYVTPFGSGSEDGSSWENAATGEELQNVIDLSEPGDSVWVSCGTYFPTNGVDRSIAFHMRNEVAIIGSFNGTEASYSERALTCGPCTELSGDIGSSGSEFDNSYKVIVNHSLDSSSVIDGFRIAHGYDDRSVSSIENGLGGGVYNGGAGVGGEGGSCSPTFRNCVIENNFATYGAGMFNNGHGGGSSAPILVNCILAFNHATVGGGGMDSYGWNNGYVAPEISNCLFYGNTSDNRAGAMYCWGGLNGNCSPVIVSTAFVNNSATTIAGGIIVDNSDGLAGNPPYTGTAEVSCSNCIFWGNTSSEGPQFYILGDGHFTATYTAVDTVGQFANHPITGPGTGNVFSYPEFQDTSNVLGIDACWMTHDDGLIPAISSPTINTGDTSIEEATDLTFGPRVSGVRIDIGPYEHVLPDTVFWSGVTDTDWFNIANWNPGRVPDSVQVVVIPGVGAVPNQPLILGDTAYCAGIIMMQNALLEVHQLLEIHQMPE